MVQLVSLVKPVGEPRANVVLVHGLGGHSHSTWGNKADGQFFWPLSLGEDIKGLAVYLVGYEAAVSRWRGTAMHLADRATSVLMRLLTEPDLRRAPLVLVGHSLGGLVIKQLLRTAESISKQRGDAAELLSRVEKVAFLATPHAGSDRATFGDRLRILVRPSAATACLVRNDPNLRDLNLWYREWADRPEISHLVLTESDPIRIFGMVVRPDSADPGLPRSRPISISADHWSICKPADRDRDVYVYLRDFIARRIERPEEAQDKKLDAVKDDTAAIRAQLDAVVRAVMGHDPERLREAGVGRELVLDLARRLKPEEALSFEQAVMEVRSAVETAIKAIEEGARGSNLGDLVDTVLKRIAERTLARDFDGAAAEADRAFGEWQRVESERRETSRAAGLRILEAGIEQDILRRAFDSAAARIASAVDLQFDDPAQRFRVLQERQHSFYIEGRDRGSNASLEVAITIGRIAVDWSRDSNDLGNAQNNLGTALAVLGERESGTARLEEAVAAYRAALEEEWTRDRVPLDWARIQNNLGNALAVLGRRESGTARLEEAIAAYGAALEEWTRERVPLHWAATQNNLGTALAVLGEREGGTARLEEAVAAYRAALKERRRERVPLDWAMTQNNLGTALRALGAREGGTARLEEAVAAHRAALEEWTRERVPLDWAMNTGNQGAALKELAARRGDLAMAQEALSQIETALALHREANHVSHAAFYGERLSEARALVAELREKVARVDNPRR